MREGDVYLYPRWAAVPRWTSNPLTCNKMYYLDTNAIFFRLLLVVREEERT